MLALIAVILFITAAALGPAWLPVGFVLFCFGGYCLLAGGREAIDTLLAFLFVFIVGVGAIAFMAKLLSAIG